MSEEFLRTVILPRLDQLEAELKALREVTWPVCQALKENGNPMSCSNEKRKFFKNLYKDEAIDLLKRKASFSRTNSNQLLFNEEFDLIVCSSSE